MHKLSCPLPDKVLVAVSGGCDSVFALRWLLPSKIAGILHVHHNTGSFSEQAQSFVLEIANHLDIPFYTTTLSGSIPEGASKEDYWRTERYKFFRKVSDELYLPVITAHNLDDCVEEYIINTIVRGRSDTIKPYRDLNYCNRIYSYVLRPFLLFPKRHMKDFLIRKGRTWLEDPSNDNVAFLRNKIRHIILPELLKINPGLPTIVCKKILAYGSELWENPKD